MLKTSGPSLARVPLGQPESNMAQIKTLLTEKKLLAGATKGCWVQALGLQEGNRSQGMQGRTGG